MLLGTPSVQARMGLPVKVRALSEAPPQLSLSSQSSAISQIKTKLQEIFQMLQKMSSERKLGLGEAEPRIWP